MAETGQKTGNYCGTSYGDFSDMFEYSITYIYTMQLKYNSNNLGTQKNQSTTTKLGGISSYSSNTIGGSTDKWGQTLTPTIINSSTFGIYLSNSNASNDLSITGFGFSVQTDATINGIQLLFRQYYTRSPDGEGGYVYSCNAGYFTLNIYYSIPMVAGNIILASNHSGKVQSNSITAQEWSKTSGTIILQSHF